MKIYSVVACCDNMGIGYNGKLPWRLRKEMNYFSKLTSESVPNRKNAVIMGRNTWESIPEKFRPLKNRWNIVMSKSIKEPMDGMDEVVASLDDLNVLLNKEEWKNKINHVFCIGGAQVYKAVFASSYSDLIFMTRIHKDIECDVFLPSLDKDDYQLLDNYLSEFSSIIPHGKTTENDVEWEVEIYKKC